MDGSPKHLMVSTPPARLALSIQQRQPCKRTMDGRLFIDCGSRCWSITRSTSGKAFVCYRPVNSRLSHSSVTKPPSRGRCPFSLNPPPRRPSLSFCQMVSCGHSYSTGRHGPWNLDQYVIWNGVGTSTCTPPFARRFFLAISSTKHTKHRRTLVHPCRHWCQETAWPVPLGLASLGSS